MQQISCFQCGFVITFSDHLSRSDECPKCRSDVRVCKNCEFYDAKVYNECRETSADPVREKDRSNLCDFFRPRGSSAGSGTGKSRDDLLAAAEALFKKKLD